MWFFTPCRSAVEEALQGFEADCGVLPRYLDEYRLKFLKFC